MIRLIEPPGLVWPTREISPVCVVKRRFKCREGREIPPERIA